MGLFENIEKFDMTKREKIFMFVGGFGGFILTLTFTVSVILIKAGLN